ARGSWPSRSATPDHERVLRPASVAPAGRETLGDGPRARPPSCFCPVFAIRCSSCREGNMSLPVRLQSSRADAAVACRVWTGGRLERQAEDISSSMRLLIIEDDRDAADYLVKAFREVGHIADHAADGEEGYALALDGGYDVLIVDRMLPKRDGLSVIGGLRAKQVEMPVLILSALGQVDDRVKGLRAGGDDYLSKPYSFSEL